MAMPWCSRFVFGVGGSDDWTTTISVRPWLRRTPTVGGMRRSATGTPAAYVVRRDRNLFVAVRYYESEAADFYALLDWAQAAESFTWYPDPVAYPALSYTVDLESPAAGADVVETRPEEFPFALEVTLELRKVDGTVWTDEYFPLEDES
jgi:hypothetical protein